MKLTAKIGLVFTTLMVGCGNPTVSTPSYSGGKVRFNHNAGYAKSVVAIKTKDSRGDFNISCSGVLIKKQWILTAAHCVVPVEPADASVGAVRAADDVRVQAQYGVDYDIEEIIYPRQFAVYKSHVERLDVALLKTKEKLPSYKVANLADGETFKRWQEENFLTGLRLRGVGYGHRDSSAFSSGRLNYLDIPYIAEYGPLKNRSTFMSVDARGKTNYSSYAPLEFMAGVRNTVACQGDSGGAAFFYTNGKWYLKGILSRAIMFYGQPDSSCGVASLTGIYADVSAIGDWIETKTSGFR